MERIGSWVILENPDPNKIYHCWHYCAHCGERWTHSQGHAYMIKEHFFAVHNCDWSSFRTVPSDVESVVIWVSEEKE